LRSGWFDEPDPSPIHYINIDYHDIQYAQNAANYPCPPQCSPVPPGWKSMQDLLNGASQDISLAAQKLPPTSLPASSCTTTKKVCKVKSPPPLALTEACRG